MDGKIMPGRLGAQAAVEYITTYWWVALLITLGALLLFYYGPVKYSTLTPRASPGGCQVYRPYGPHSTTYMSEKGDCWNWLPQFMAVSSGNGDITTNMVIDEDDAGTVTAWIYPTSFNGVQRDVLSSLIYIDKGDHSLRCDYGSTDKDSGYKFTLDEWLFVACSYDTGYEYFYANGTLVYSSQVNGGGGTLLPIAIGGGPAPSNERVFFSGYITNVQLYNKSLSGNDIYSIYHAGVGAPPSTSYLQYLVAWWPLNGNGNDYSGNRNSGTENGLYFAFNYPSINQVPGP